MLGLDYLKCSMCGEEKPKSEFHKRTCRLRGYQSKCKMCVSQYYREKYATDPEHKRKRNNFVNRWRANNPDAWSEIAKRCRDKHDYQGQYPRVRKRASWRVKEAIRSGRMKRLPCNICGERLSHAHHCDYNKPLEVMFLCADHHRGWHRIFKPTEVI